MTKFETIGTQNLMASVDKRDAARRYQWSCDACCMRGIHLSCDRCAIEATYRNVVAAIETAQTQSQSQQSRDHKQDKHGKQSRKPQQSKGLNSAQMPDEIGLPIPTHRP